MRARVSETGVKDIFAFIDAGDNARLGAYLDARPQAASARNPQNVSAISYALYRRNHDAVKMLRDRVLSLDIWEAAAPGDEKTVRVLLQPGDDSDALSPDGYTPLQLASFFGRENTVSLLLNLGAARTRFPRTRRRPERCMAPPPAAISASRGS